MTLNTLENIKTANPGNILISPIKRTESLIEKVKDNHYIVRSKKGKGGIKTFAELLNRKEHYELVKMDEESIKERFAWFNDYLKSKA